MAYFKSVNNSLNLNGNNAIYVQAQNMLWAVHFIERKSLNALGQSVTKVSEDEFVINACVNKSLLNGYDRGITAMNSKEIKKHIIPALENERKINPTIEMGSFTKTLLNLVNACDNANNSSNRIMFENVLKNWIIYNYEHQDEILNQEELFSKNA